jgi:bacteriochlorophyll 4-vinyl reductase
MSSTATRPSELALPAQAFTALRDALHAQVGPDAAAAALRMAGFAAGESFFRILADAGDEDLGRLPAVRFWKQFARLFASRGWGQFSYTEPHPGVGSLEAADWVESRGEEGSGQPACHFTTGLLSSLLGKVAGAEVGVMEVECRGRGDARCRFLFGGTDAVYSVYERVAAGEPADSALQQIG